MDALSVSGPLVCGQAESLNGYRLAGVLGLLAWWMSANWRWIAGAMLIVANWPFTLMVIMPTNRKLKAIGESDAGPQSRALLETSGRLHAIRTVLGCAATAAYLWALN